MDKGVTILVPVLHRAKNLAPLMESITENTKDAYVIFIRSPGSGFDEVREELSRLFFQYDNMEYRKCPSSPGPGDYARKINLCLDWVFTEWIFTGADDLKFHPNWFENAMKVATDDIHVIGTNDLGNQRVMEGRHSTHSLVRTTYARDVGLTADLRANEILHTGYWHEYVDDELCGVAQHRKIWAFANDSIVEHLHPHWGKGEYDDSYSEQSTRMTFSRSHYLSRKKLWT